MAGMNRKPGEHTGPGGRVPLLCTRRTVLAGGLGLVALSTLVRDKPGTGTNSLDNLRQRGLAFFADSPMIDPSGSLLPYRPPSGFRGGAPIARMDQRARRALDPFMPG